MGQYSPFSGMTGASPGPEGQAPSSFDPSKMVGAEPSGPGEQPGGGQRAEADEIVRKTMSELDGYSKGIESLSKRFPGASKDLRAANEALQRALKAIIQQMRSEEPSPRTAI